MKKLFLLLAVLMFLGCQTDDTNSGSDDNTTNSSIPSSLSVSKSAVSLTIDGAGEAFTVAAKAVGGNSESYTVVSSNTAVATIVKSASTVTVYPVAEGSSTVTVTSASGHSTIVQVTVSTSVYVNGTSYLSVDGGFISLDQMTNSTVFNVQAYQSNGSVDTFTVTSNDTQVVTVTIVDKSVTVNAVNTGSTSVTVTTASGMTISKGVHVSNTAGEVSLNMQTGVFKVKNTKLYDSGGPTANYANNENRRITFYPANSADKVGIHFDNFQLDVFSDTLNIYDGPSTSDTLVSSKKYTNMPADFNSTHSTGALTVEFISGGASTDYGWSADITTSSVEDGLLGLSSENVTVYTNADSQAVNVTAIDTNGALDTFVVDSNDTNIATVTKVGNTINISAVGEGDALVTVTTASGLTQTINVTSHRFYSEGTSTDPIVLTVDQHRLTGVGLVGSGDHNSYYTFQTAEAGIYTIEHLTSYTGVQKQVFQGGFDGPMISVMNDPSDVLALDANTTYSIQLINYNSFNMTFDIGVIKHNSVGTIDVPLPLTVDQNHMGIIGGFDDVEHSTSYYTFTPNISGWHALNFEQITANWQTAVMTVYSDASFTNTVIRSGTASDLVAGTPYYIKVNHSDSLCDRYSHYSIYITEPASAGSISSPLQFSDINNSISLYCTGRSYGTTDHSYTYSTFISQQDANVTLAITYSSLDPTAPELFVYSDSNFTTELPNNKNAYNETGSPITVEVQAGKQYYVKTVGRSNYLNDFNVTLFYPFGSDGSIASAQPLVSGTPFQGKIGVTTDTSKSYYSFTPATTGTYLYTIKGTSYDTLYILSGNGTYHVAAELHDASSYDIYSKMQNLSSGLSMSLNAGVTYYIRLDNGTAGDNFAYDISIELQ